MKDAPPVAGLTRGLMVISLTSGGRVQGDIIQTVKSTVKALLGTVGLGVVVHGHGMFPLTSVIQIPSQQKHGAGSDKPKLTWPLPITTFLLQDRHTCGLASNVTR